MVSKLPSANIAIHPATSGPEDCALLTLIAIASQALIYIRQAKIMRAQNRAFVFLDRLQLDAMDIDAEEDKETAWRVIVVVRNSGPLPREISWWISSLRRLPYRK